MRMAELGTQADALSRGAVASGAVLGVVVALYHACEKGAYAALASP